MQPQGFLLLLAVLAAVASAQVYMTEYNEYTCKGSVAKQVTLPTGQCTDESGFANVSGVQLTCPAANAPPALCGKVGIYFGTEKCGSGFGDIQQNVPCGVCAWERARGYHQYTCDQVQRQATYRAGCDQHCMVCNDTTVLPLNQCAQTDGAYSSMKLLALQTCPAFIREVVWYGGAKCSGGSSHRMVLEQNACYEGLMFSCTAPPKRGGAAQHRKGDAATARRMVQRFLRGEAKQRII